MKDFNTTAAEIGALVTEKNLYYGNSFAKCGDFLRLLYPAGITPPQYDDALAMVRIFDKQMRIATRKDAFGESPYRDIAGYGILGAVKDTPPQPEVGKNPAPLCPSCRRYDTECHGANSEYPATADGGCEGYIKAESVATAKQAPPTAADTPLDFTLPSIALKCTAEEAWKKFESELKEWRAAELGSAEELIERWDCLQAVQTFYERGGNLGHYQTHVQIIMHDLAKWFSMGRDVMVARAAMVVKNARRNYYAPEVNAAIIATNGASFAP
jgi:hypothetical protein